MENEQRLGEFVTNLLDDLQSGAITAEEAIIASSQYEYVRSLFSQRTQGLAEAAASGDEALKNSLVSIFSQTKSSLAELPAFSSQTPDIVRDEKQTRDIATLERAAFETVRKETKTKFSSRKQTRREFIHALVSQYSARTNSPISETKMDSLVDSALSGASKEQSSQGAKQHFIKDLSQKFGISDSMFEKALGSLVSKDSTNTVISSWKDVQTEKEALVTLFTHSDLSRPDVVVDVFIHASDKENPSDISARATKLAQTASAISALGIKQPTVKGPFFSNSNTKGLINGLQQAADGILSLVGEPLREIIIKEKINGVIRSILTNTNQLADKLGEQFVQSPVFGFISQNILKNTNEKPSMSRPTAVFSDVFSSIFRGPFDYSMSRPTAVFSDVFSSIFRGPFDYSTTKGGKRTIFTGPLGFASTQGAKDNLFNYLELARASSNAPKGYSFFKPNVMPWHLSSLHAEYLLTTKKGAASRGSWRPSFVLQSLQGLTSLGGNTLATVFDRFVGFVFTGSSLSRQIHSSRRAAVIPLPLSEDLPLLLAIVVVSTIVILYVFPTFFNIPHLSMTQKMSALLASLSEIKSSIIEGKIICTGDCRWPTAGTITQGPATPLLIGSHNGSIAQSIDIGASCGTPVHSTVSEGVVVENGVFDGCVDNTGFFGNKCGGGWGNYVIISGKVQTSQSSQISVSLRYSHLVQGSMPGEGSVISLGQQIGLINNNGNSSGCHLHYEVVGGQPEINTILPYSVPSCVTGALCCLQMGDKCHVTP